METSLYFFLSTFAIMRFKSQPSDSTFIRHFQLLLSSTLFNTGKKYLQVCYTQIWLGFMSLSMQETSWTAVNEHLDYSMSLGQGTVFVSFITNIAYKYEYLILVLTNRISHKSWIVNPIGKRKGNSLTRFDMKHQMNNLQDQVDLIEET